MSINVVSLVLLMKTFSITYHKLLGNPAVTPARNGDFLHPFLTDKSFQNDLFTFIRKSFMSWTNFSRVLIISTKINNKCFDQD